MWDFKGELIHAAANFPVSWHDSILAAGSGLYSPRLVRKTPLVFALLADSAFPSTSEVLAGKILRSKKDNEHNGGKDILRSSYLAAVDILLKRAMPRARQSAEPGLRTIKGLFQ